MLSDLAIHTFTNKPWSIHECIENYARKGIGGISIWRETITGCDLAKVKKHLGEAGVKPVSLVRGGFFTGATKEARHQAIESNLTALSECEALGIDKIGGPNAAGESSADFGGYLAHFPTSRGVGCATFGGTLAPCVCRGPFGNLFLARRERPL